VAYKYSGAVWGWMGGDRSGCLEVLGLDLSYRWEEDVDKERGGWYQQVRR